MLALICLFFLLVILYLYSKRRKIQKVLVVTGIIGPGKSTLLNILENNKQLRKKYPKIVVIREPIEIWEKLGALKEFYQDKAGKAYEFQTLVFATRILTVNKAVKENPDADLYILERNPDCDQFAFFQTLYEEGCVQESQMEKYKLWANTWRLIYPFKTTHVLFIDPGIEICMERLRKRNRDGEAGISQEYQEHLYRNYSKMIDECKDKTLRLILTTDYRQEGKEQNLLIDLILNFLKQ